MSFYYVKKGENKMKITQEKLNQVITSHGKWLRREDGGERANLRKANLQGVDLHEADLRDADLDQTYYQITRIGSRNATTTYCIEKNNVVCGCWNHYRGGTLADFKERVKNIYDNYGEMPNKRYYRQYMAAIEFFEKMAELGKE